MKDNLMKTRCWFPAGTWMLVHNVYAVHRVSSISTFGCVPANGGKTQLSSAAMIFNGDIFVVERLDVHQTFMVNGHKTKHEEHSAIRV